MTMTLATPTKATSTGRLLACGVLAGPLFVVAVLIQALTRDGYDLGRHPISLLSLGSPGWIQIANFALTGLLLVACAVGLRRALNPGRAGTWGPLLVGAQGIGLILAGVFVTDAGAGFPPGAPEGAPQISWHGILHEVGFVLGLGMLVGYVVFARRFAALRERGWVIACYATLGAVVIINAWPDPDSLSVRLLIGAAISFGFVAALSTRLLRSSAPGAP